MKHKTPKYLMEETNESFIEFKEDVKLTPKQKELVKLIVENKITLITGPAGTAKTFCAAYAACKLMDKYPNDYRRIIITKPTEIVGDTALGFTPGSLEEKLMIYMENFQDVFEDILEDQSYRQMVSAKEIVYKAPQFVRGRTLKNSIVIVDEFQSFDIHQLMAIATRMGKDDTKFIFCGDIKQNDINKKYVALNLFKLILKDLPRTTQFEFEKEDNMRDPLVQQIVERFEQMEAAGLITPNKKNA